MAVASEAVTVFQNPSAAIQPGGPTTFCQVGLVTLTASGGTSYLWNTGETTPVIGVTASGEYMVTATNMQGCIGSASIGVTVYDLPDVALDVFTPVCFDSLPFVLSGGSPAGGFYEGTGVGGNVFNPALAGVGSHVITYIYMDTATGCSNSDTQILVVNPLPPVTLALPTPVCVQTPPFILTGGFPMGGVYEGEGVSGGMFDPAVAGIGTHVIHYTFMNSGTGCDATVPAEIEVDSAISQSISLTVSATNICVGDTVFFETTTYGGGASPTYQWLINGSPVGIDSSVFSTNQLNDGDVVNCVLSSSESCASPNPATSTPVTITVYDLPDVSFTTGCLPGLVYDTTAAFPLVCGTPPGGEYFCDNLPCTIFDPSAAGLGEHGITYSFTDANGCTAAVSVTITVEMVNASGEKGRDSGIRVFPNPSGGIFSLQAKSIHGAVQLTVLDVWGRSILERETEMGAAGEAVLDLRHLPGGLYLLRLQKEEVQYLAKLVVQ